MCVEAILDKLSPLPPSTVSCIRRILTKGKFLMLGDASGAGGTCTWSAYVLKLLTSLRLDQLIVLGPFEGHHAYETVHGLVEHGNGWKEMIFITAKSDMLEFTVNRFYGRRCRPQPETWNQILLQRDGADSGACVTVHRAPDENFISVLHGFSLQGPNEKWNVRSTYARLVFGADIPSSTGSDDEDAWVDEEDGGEEILVIAKRGRNPEIVDRSSSPHHLDDIRDWSQGMAWPKIRRKSAATIDIVGNTDHHHQDWEVEADQYDDVDEYQRNWVDSGRYPAFAIDRRGPPFQGRRWLSRGCCENFADKQ